MVVVQFPQLKLPVECCNVVEHFIDRMSSFLYDDVLFIHVLSDANAKLKVEHSFVITGLRKAPPSFTEIIQFQTSSYTYV